MSTEPEIHLILLWENALVKQSEIIADVQSKFEILARFKLYWSAANFSRNLTRFYGKKLPDGSFKEKECGRGPFLVLIVKDHQPRYEQRLTSRGTENVNANLFDVKSLYREWTGGGHKVHTSNSVAEARHDAGLLFGCSPAELVVADSSSIVDLNRDLSGANGWSNLTELFQVLNLASNYLVLRNFEGFPERYHLDKHNDIDLLTDDLSNLVYVSNAERAFKARYRVHYYVPISGQKVPFDFRYLNDGYYDSRWQLSMLSNRVLQTASFYSPNPEDYFYSLLYHALLHKKDYAPDYQQRLFNMAQQLNLADESKLKNPGAAFKLLQGFLQQQGYELSEPDDRSVFLNPNYFPTKKFSLRRKLKFNFSQKIVKPLIKKV